MSEESITPRTVEEMHHQHNIARAGSALDAAIQTMGIAVDRARQYRQRETSPQVAREVLHALMWGLANATSSIETALAAFEDANTVEKLALQKRLEAAEAARGIPLTAAERQSGLDRVRQAQGLIVQLPENHDGRNTWLMNFGTRDVAEPLQKRWEERAARPFPGDEAKQ